MEKINKEQLKITLKMDNKSIKNAIKSNMTIKIKKFENKYHCKQGNYKKLRRIYSNIDT